MMRQTMAVVAIAEESQLPALVGTISRTFAKRLCKKCEQSVKTEGSVAPAAPPGEKNVVISANSWDALKSSKSRTVNAFVPLASWPKTGTSTMGIAPAAVLPEGGFDLFQFATELQTHKFGRSIVYFPYIDSTQDFLHEMIEDERQRVLSGDVGPQAAVEGIVCVADVQTKGKGRSGNVWQSPLGCLMFSFLSKYTDGKQMPMVQYLLSVAMARGVCAATRSTALPNPCMRIKWPNDFYASVPTSVSDHNPEAAPSALPATTSTTAAAAPALPAAACTTDPSPATASTLGPGLHKVGGIICHSSYQQTRGVGTFTLVAGIGLNVDNSRPTMALRKVIQLNGLTRDPRVTRAELLARFFNNFEPMHGEFRRRGFAPFESEYLAQWLHTGQEVTFEDQTGTHDTKPTAVIQGLADSGCLLARLKDTGKVVELMPDSGRLDMMQGLLLRASTPRI